MILHKTSLKGFDYVFSLALAFSIHNKQHYPVYPRGMNDHVDRSLMIDFGRDRVLQSTVRVMSVIGGKCMCDLFSGVYVGCTLERP